MSTQSIRPFLFEGETMVRVVERYGSPWFALADACRALKISNSRDAASRLDDDEKGVVLSDTPGGRQEITIISESGLYCLIVRSNGATKPGTVAHRFRKWVTSEVLPSIRRTGRYEAHASPPLPDSEADDGLKLRMVAEARQNFGVPSAAQLWFKLGLPTVPAMFHGSKQTVMQFAEPEGDMQDLPN